ncbi:alpha/beta fold hydrolase [Sinosporangium siamense]|nr:alpha/beta fold hydrolase [Sinosporangium siamense]
MTTKPNAAEANGPRKPYTPAGQARSAGRTEPDAAEATGRRKPYITADHVSSARRTEPDAAEADGRRKPYIRVGQASADRTTRRFTVHHDGVTIPVTRGGRGRPLVLCPGLNSTQADLHELTDLLRRDHDVVTFDLRGHGLASAAGSYSFESFLGDLAAVLEPGRLGLPSAPVVVGYSLGADLAVNYAAAHPGAVAGLVLIDGANPVPEPFITEDALPEFRTMFEDLAARQQGSLTGREILELNVEIDAIRAGILDRYRRIDRPISVIISTSMAGAEERFNRNWRAGAERLARELPHISTSWLDADHRLVFTHAPEIAQIIRTFMNGT